LSDSLEKGQHVRNLFNHSISGCSKNSDMAQLIRASTKDTLHKSGRRGCYLSPEQKMDRRLSVSEREPVRGAKVNLNLIGSA
jgi:hypothetical protein